VLRYRFGPFELNASAGELKRRGVRVPLVGQPLRILHLLLQNPERIVSREELRSALWPDGVHVDFDGALNTAVKKLRQSLEDNAEIERYIQTVPREGYRFVSPVELVMPAPAAPLSMPVVSEGPAPVAAEPDETPAWRRKWFLTAAASLLLVCAVVGWEGRRMLHAPASEGFEKLTSRAFLTSFPGEQTVPALSPDGGQVAFSWADPARDKVSSIYVTSIGGQGLHRMTSAGSSDYGPAWSPDGSRIAFVRQAPDHGDVIVIPSSGGPERRIAETDGRFVAWAPDGGAVLIAKKVPAERSFELWSVSLATGERRMLSPPGEDIDGWERVNYSPDGSLLGYAAWSGPKGPAELYVRPVSGGRPGGKPRQVTSLGTRLRGWWCWMPDSRSVLVVSEEQGTRRLFRIAIDDPHAAPQPVEGAGEDLQYPAVTVAGGKVRVVFSQQRLTSNLHRFAIRRDGRGIPVSLGPERTIAASTRMTVNPELSPSGRRMAFVSDRSLFTEIWLSDADGSSPHPLTSFSSSRIVPGSPQWSPDSQKVVFAALFRDVTDLYLSAADGGPLAQLTHQSMDVIRPSFSHDGRWIYFSARGTAAERLRLWKIPARPDASERDAVSLGVEGMEPIESTDAGTIFYAGLDGRELWSVSSTGAGPHKVIGSGIMNGWWTPVHGGIYYVDLTKTSSADEPAHPPVLYFDLATGTSRVIGELPATPNIQQPGISVSGDGLWTDWPEVSAMNLITGELSRSQP